MTFELARLDTAARSEAGVSMPVTDLRTGQPFTDEDGAAVQIVLRGRNSDAFRTAQRRIQERRTAILARGASLSREDIQRNDIELLEACTAGWTALTLDGQPFPYSAENARRLWADPRFEWLTAMAVAFIGNDGNFLAP